MTTLYVMVGLPASGKSTWAQSHADKCIVVSTDEIRAEMFNDASNQSNGKAVFDEAHRRVEEALNKGYNVIVDAQNYRQRDRKQWLKYNAYLVAVYVNTPVEECKRRNAQRSRQVPTEIIERNSKRLSKPTIEEGFSIVLTV